MRKLLLAMAGMLSLAVSATAFAADYKIMAPAAPGGGWDQTARSMQTALQDEGDLGQRPGRPTSPAPAARSALPSSSTRPMAIPRS